MAIFFSDRPYVSAAQSKEVNVLANMAGLVNINGKNVKVTAATDGNLNTYHDYYNNEMPIVYALPEEKRVVGFRLKTNDDVYRGAYIALYDARNVLLTKIKTGGNSGYKGNYTYYSIPKVDNVTRVQVDFFRDSSYQHVYLYEVEVYVDTNDTIPPDMPTGLKSTSMVNQIRLDWNENKEPDLFGYNVFVDGKLYNDKPIQSNSLVFDSPPTIKREIRVSAIDTSENESLRSDSVEGMAYPELVKPLLMVASDVNAAYLSWKSEYKPFEVFMGSMQIGSSSSGAFQVSNLKPNTSYNFFIRAKDPYGRTVQSDTVTMVTKPPPAPVPPKINVINIKHNAMTVTWEGSPYASKFRLLMDGKTFKDDMKEKFLLVDKLAPKQSYTFQIEEQDVFGRTVMSKEITASTVDLPPAYLPKLQATNITEDSARLLWNSVGKTYKLYQGSNLIRETSSLFYVVNGLSEETEYKFKLVAVDEFDRENESNEVVVLTLKKPPPKPKPDPRPDPPNCNNSGNTDLDKGSDYLCEGGTDLKKSGLELIMIIIGIIILIFGILWLLKIFKKKMAKSAPRSSLSNGSSGTSMGNAKKPPSANGGRGSPRAPMLKNRGTNISNFTQKSNLKGKKYHVEKTRYTRERSYKKR